MKITKIATMMMACTIVQAADPQAAQPGGDNSNIPKDCQINTCQQASAQGTGDYCWPTTGFCPTPCQVHLSDCAASGGGGGSGGTTGPQKQCLNCAQCMNPNVVKGERDDCIPKGCDDSTKYVSIKCAEFHCSPIGCGTDDPRTDKQGHSKCGPLLAESKTGLTASGENATCKPIKKECSNCPCGGLDVKTAHVFHQKCQVSYAGQDGAPSKEYETTSALQCHCLSQKPKLYPAGESRINGQQFALFCLKDSKNPVVSNNCSKKNCPPPYADYEAIPGSGLYQDSACGWMVWPNLDDAAFRIQMSGALAIASIAAALSL